MIGSDGSGGGGGRGGGWGHYPRMCRDSCPDLSSEWEEERKKGGQINRERWPRAEKRSGEWMETKEGGKKNT